MFLLKYKIRARVWGKFENAIDEQEFYMLYYILLS